MNKIFLLLFLLISLFGNSQESSGKINGEWFSCDKRDFNIGDTIYLDRDSCLVNYEHNGNEFEIQVSFEFAKNHFSIFKNSGVIAGGTYYKYWELKSENLILTGNSKNDIIEKYVILDLSPTKMVLIKKIIKLK